MWIIRGIRADSQIRISLKVIFLQNIKNVAQIGDIKKVADGYARNFLLPRNLAKKATEQSQKEAEALKLKHAITAEARKERATKWVGELEGMVLETTAEANEEGHLYGSITVEDIAKLLNDKKFQISEDEINLAQPIKAVGEYDIELELAPEVKTSIKLKVSNRSLTASR